VAKRGGRRGRSRKSRGASRAAPEPAQGSPAGERSSSSSPEQSPDGNRPAAAATATAAAASPRTSDKRAARRERRRAQRRTPREGRGGLLSEQVPLGERPQAPWHPLPLSELLIFVGLVAVIIGATRGESGLPVVAAGVLSAVVGTLDFTIREHLSGYRPHTTLLATFVTALLYGLLAIVLLALGVPAPAYFVVPLVVAVPLFTFLFRLLRARFREARRERTFVAGR
jgi:hypothetical protein